MTDRGTETTSTGRTGATPTRRAVLAATGALLSAGCIEGSGATGPTDRVRTPTDQRSVTGGSTPTETFTMDQHTGAGEEPDGCTAGFEVTLRRVDVAEWLTLRLDDRRRTVVRTAIEDGEAEVTQYGDVPPVPDGAYVEYGGIYYETSASDAGTTEVPAVVTNVEWEKGREAPADAEVVRFEDLPESDREALDRAIYGGEGDEEQGHPSEGLSVRDAPVPYPEGTANSTLAGEDTTWVRWRERVYEVWTEGEATKTRYEFRIGVSKVAADASAFRELAAERHFLGLSGLSDAERAVLEGALEDYYEACEDDAGVTALRERLDDDDRLPQPRNQHWYVEFRGSRYALAIYRWVH